TNLYTGEAFEFTLAHIEQLRALEVAQLSRPERFWLLVESGDELLDYRLAVTKYAGARQTVLEGGDHSFTRWSDTLDDIIQYAGF
ncbi:MAG: esterase, partial [Proteobacteria bacterium]|nr:esterase [Pseudomonadota bacterium]